jgi:hypothetical protein
VSRIVTPPAREIEPCRRHFGAQVSALRIGPIGRIARLIGRTDAPSSSDAPKLRRPEV